MHLVLLVVFLMVLLLLPLSVTPLLRLFGVGKEEVVEIHVTVKVTSDDVSVLPRPQNVFLPAPIHFQLRPKHRNRPDLRCVPALLRTSPCRRHMPHQDHFGALLAENLKLHVEPFELVIARFTDNITAIHGSVGVEEVP